MNIAVVPAKDEKGRISKVLDTLSKAPVDRILVVLNGSSDGTLQEIKEKNIPTVDLLIFEEPLGYDIPRAVGVFYALKNNADCVIFVDGDMTGDLAPVINKLAESILSKNADLALTLCIPDKIRENKIAKRLYYFRKLFNTRLGIYEKINVAIPSHGPCAISRNLMNLADIRDFAVPPVISALAVKKSLSIQAPIAIQSRALGSKERGFFHAKKIADTIIGDIIEAMNYFEGKPRTRTLGSKEYQGFNPLRRFDLLENFIKTFT
ncbi:glycosyltransferase [Thermovorax subterraneus]|nr:glycosyltransferase [Thermovorax subterraneus]